MANSSLIIAAETPTVKVVHVKVKATAGTWKFSVNGGALTSGLAFDVSGSAATTAADLVSTPGTVVVTGGPGDSAGSTDYVFTSSSDVLTIVTDATSLTGSTHTAAVTTATEGVPVWGNVPSTGWREIPIKSDGHKTRVKQITESFISSAAGSAASAEFTSTYVEGGDGVVDTGGFSNGLGILWATACDTASTAVHAAGTLAHDQVFTWGPAGPPLSRSLAREMRRLRKGTSTLDAFTHSGGRCTQLDIGVDIDANLSLKWTFDDKDVERQSSLPSRSIAQIDPDVLYNWTQATINVDGAAICATSVNLVLPTGNDPDDKCIKAGDIRHEPSRKGRPALTGTLNWKYVSPDYYDDWVTGELLPLSITFVGPVAIEGSTYPSLTIDIGAIRFTGDDPQVSFTDPTTQQLPFEIIVDADNTITVTNVTSDTAF